MGKIKVKGISPNYPLEPREIGFSDADETLYIGGENGQNIPVGGKGGGGGGIDFTTDESLSLEDGVLSVNTAKDVEEDNTLPVTSAAVYVELGNINALLETI